MFKIFLCLCCIIFLNSSCAARRADVKKTRHQQKVNETCKPLETTPIAATELDILIPAVQLDDVLVGLADVTPVAGDSDADGNADNAHVTDKSHRNHGQLYYNAILIVLGAIAVLLMMSLVSHCLWRQHIKRRAAEWEAENARILCQAPYYVDRGQIYVY